MTTTQFLETYQKYGLEINSLTGGQYLKAGKPTVIDKPKVGIYEFNFDDGESFTFFSPQLFLDTIRQTEESLKVKLFK